MTNTIGTEGYGPTVYTYKAGQYPKYKSTFTGTSASVAYSASVYYAKGWEVDITAGSVWTMDANLSCEVGSDGITPITGTGSFVTVNWSYHYKTTDKELLHVNQDVIPWINQITQSDKTALEYVMANPPKNGIVDISSGSGNFSTSSASLYAANVVWNMYNAGVRTMPIITPILRQTLKIPSTFNMTGFNTNVYSVYTKSTLQTAIGIPTNWYNIMPQGTDPSSSDTYSIPYHYGWQKQPPSQDQDGTTITVQQDFEYGLYPQNLYGSAL